MIFRAKAGLSASDFGRKASRSTSGVRTRSAFDKRLLLGIASGSVLSI